MKKLTNVIPIVLLLLLGGCYSCESWNKLWGTGPVEPYGAEKLFFDKDCKPIVAAPAPKPAPKAKPRPKPVARPTECGPNKVTRTYPCSSCGVVKIDKIMPSEVQANAAFTYDITATNLTDMMITNVIVTENLPSDFKYMDSSPSARLSEGKLMWVLPSLKGGEVRKMKVRGMASGAAKCLKYCATVTYTIPACANVKVVQPKLKLTKTAPSAVLLCEPIPVKLVVTNTGTGSAENVKITDTLPAGLQTSNGKRSVVLNAGTLAGGQSKQFTMNLKASKTGTYVNKAVASSAGNLTAQASTTTVVRQPVLAITKSGPAKRYLGRSITFDITVTNKGDAAASDLILEDRVPAGTKFVSASGGSMAAGKVVWKIGTLNAGASRKVSMTVMPGSAGTVVNSVTAKATCAEGVSASAKTSIEGIPAVLLEVIDIDDPVEIGGTTTYVITATNQGSAPGTNIKIVCGLESNEQYVSSGGATSGSIVGNTVTFAPLRSLAPKAKAVWKIKVKAVKPGDVRFKVTMNTDQIDRPVEETEATHLYQ